MSAPLGDRARTLSPAELRERVEPDDRTYIEVLRAVAERVVEGGRRARDGANTPGEWGELAAATIPNDRGGLALRRLAGKLIACGVPGLMTEALLQAWNRCYVLTPLPAEEVTEAVRYAAGREVERLRRGDR